MQASFKLGCNCDPALTKRILSLNARFPDRPITEFYGSIRQHHQLTARPAFRLPDLSIRDLEQFLTGCRAAGIGFDYMLNTPYIGPKRRIDSTKRQMVNTIRLIVELGVTAVTVATPLMALLVREAAPDVALRVSTIAHVDTLTQIEAWDERYRTDAVCVHLWKNRSIGFLKAAATLCKERGITLTVLANEFCFVGSERPERSYGTHCIFRDSCYLCHAENETADDDKLLEWYPMGPCTRSRHVRSSWLKARFIRPEDVSKYEQIGVGAFKITGRTASTAYISRVAEAYLCGRWHGDLLELWQPLESIHGMCSEGWRGAEITLPNELLDGFVDFWFQNTEHDCGNHVCGLTCRYCDDFWAKAVNPRTIGG